MKRCLLFVMVICGSCQYAYADVGEFFVGWNGTAGNSISVSINKQGYAWTWTNNTVVLVSSFGNTYYNLPLEFAAPTSNNGEPQGVMPWGLMQFQISVNGGAWGLTFQIDFRDQDWSGIYGSSDFYLYVDNGQKQIFLRNGNNPDRYITSNQTVYIWSFGDDHDPSQSNFKIPLTVKNVIGSSNAGGTLHVDGLQYSSGSSPSIGYFSNHTVKTDNERFTNYQGGGVTYKHNHWNSALADYLLTDTYTPIYGTNEDDAILLSLSGATLNNSLDGTVYTGPNGGYIPFVDPWYVDANGNQTGQAVNITSGSSPTGAYGQSSGGVFLGQQIISGQPYYSLRAPVSQTINGHTGYFGDWSMSPSGSVTFQNAASATTAVVFNSAGGTVTANYIYATVTRNSTFQAATYNFAGTLTVNSGVTLTINSGAVLNFPAGAGLVVNGAVNANGVKFNFTQSSPYSGITINSNGSSLTNCTISGADQPIAINNTSSCTLSADSIKNSNFNSSNGVLVNNSTPTVTHLTIAGQ